MDALLDLLFQNPRSLRLVEASDLEDVGSVDPAVGFAPHHGHILTLELVDGHARIRCFVDGHGRVVRRRVALAQ